jgi:hypothetical protein
MPSPIAHAAAGYVAYRLFHANRADSSSKTDWLLLSTTGFFAMLPDIDIALGLIYGDLGRFHNQESHSLLLGLLLAALFAGLMARRQRHNFLRWFSIAGICYALHVILDSLAPGRGVLMLWPLSDVRFISPVPFFYGLHWSEGIFSLSHIWTAGSELLIAMVALFFVIFWSRRHQSGQSQ